MEEASESKSHRDDPNNNNNNNNNNNKTSFKVNYIHTFLDRRSIYYL